MKIFVNCQKDAFNKSYNSNSKKYNMGQAMIDAVADKENILLIMETHTKGNFCVNNTPGWDLIDEIQAVISVLDDERMIGIMALSTLTPASMKLPIAVKECIKDGPVDIEFIGPLLDVGILQNIILLKNTMPGLNIKISLKKCGATTKENRDAALTILKNLDVEITD